MNNKDIFNRLADIIKYHRKQSGLNRAQLSLLSGVGKTVIYDIEHGKSTVRFENIIKILNVLNISIDFQSPLIKSMNQPNLNEPYENS